MAIKDIAVQLIANSAEERNLFLRHSMGIANRLDEREYSEEQKRLDRKYARKQRNIQWNREDEIRADALEEKYKWRDEQRIEDERRYQRDKKYGQAQQYTDFMIKNADEFINPESMTYSYLREIENQEGDVDKAYDVWKDKESMMLSENLTQLSETMGADKGFGKKYTTALNQKLQNTFEEMSINIKSVGSTMYMLMREQEKMGIDPSLDTEYYRKVINNTLNNETQMAINKNAVAKGLYDDYMKTARAGLVNTEMIQRVEDYGGAEVVFNKVFGADARKMIVAYQAGRMYHDIGDIMTANAYFKQIGALWQTPPTTAEVNAGIAEHTRNAFDAYQTFAKNYNTAATSMQKTLEGYGMMGKIPTFGSYKTIPDKERFKTYGSEISVQLNKFADMAKDEDYDQLAKKLRDKDHIGALHELETNKELVDDMITGWFDDLDIEKGSGLSKDQARAVVIENMRALLQAGIHLEKYKNVLYPKLTIFEPPPKKGEKEKSPQELAKDKLKMYGITVTPDSTTTAPDSTTAIPLP